MNPDLTQGGLIYGPFLKNHHQALAFGLKRYSTGKPCKYGHQSERYAATGICVQCVRNRKGWNRKPLDVVFYGPFIDRETAQAQGLNQFFTAAVCKKGHLSTRYTNGSGCVQCAKARANKWKKANHVKHRARSRELEGTPVVVARRRREFLRREADPQRRALGRIRCLIKQTVVKYGGRKAARTEELLGCTVEAARAHLEAQFLPGMSWENHGQWHIDHIRPAASFGDHTMLKVQQACHHFTNLQPLWAEDNIRKSDKWEPAAA